MKIYLPIAKVDAAQRMVMGYASTEARDDQGETVKREALDAALVDYMKFANIREMHQLSAVGKAQDAAVDDKGLYIAAKVVDDQAWMKVVERVYQGFSIGGKVTAREPADYKTITGLRLDEISLVDRPANPEAVFDCWKRSASSPNGGQLADDPVAALKAAIERVEALVKKGDDNVGLQPAGLTRGEGDKPYGDVEYADPGYQDDKKKRYPIDTEKHIRAAWNYINKPKNGGKYSADEVKRIKAKIVAAWKDKIDPDGPPSADDGEKAARVEMAKSLADVGGVAQVIMGLDWLKDMLETEAAMEGDDSPQPARLGGVIDELCGFLNALVAEETAEIQSGEGLDLGGPIAMAAVAESLKKSGLAGRALLFKARHSGEDQALLDVAYGATRKAAAMDGIGAGDKEHCGKACDAMKAAGAHESSGEDFDAGHGKQPRAPGADRDAAGAGIPAGRLYDGQHRTGRQGARPHRGRALGKRRGAHKALVKVAHDCLGKMTDGKTCATEKAMAPAFQGDDGPPAGGA